MQSKSENNEASVETINGEDKKFASIAKPKSKT